MHNLVVNQQRDLRHIGVFSFLVLQGVIATTAPSCRCDSNSGQTNTEHEFAWSPSENGQDAPISLTASDGTGLRLLDIEAKAVVQDPLAFTELHLTFENTEDRVREGHFEITLPPGAAVSRFAMKIGDQWQEAEVVERQKARVTYEDFLHRRQDPALLEKKAGNQFSARVFPIPPQARKELIVAYSEELLEASYALHVAGLPRIESFRATVNHLTSTEQARQYTFEEKRFTPEGNLTLKAAVPVGSASGFTGLKNGDLAVVKIIPKFSSSAASLRSLTILLDTSASSAPGFEDQLEKLPSLLSHLKIENGADFRLNVICFDQVVFRAYTGNVSGFGASHIQLISDRDALGASNLENALSTIHKENAGVDRLLIISDGIVTAGKLDHAALQKQISALSKTGLKRVDVIADGGIRDEALLRALVTTDSLEAGIVADDGLSTTAIAAKMMRATRTQVKVNVPDSKWVWPRVLKGVQSGEPALIYVGIDENRPVKVHLEGITDGPVEVQTGTVSRPLIERSSAIAQIDMVSAQLRSVEDEQQKSALQERIVALSISHRVLSDYTALLVLETEYDYARFNINRNALTDILVVGENGIELMQRSVLNVPKPITGPNVARAQQGRMGRRGAPTDGIGAGIRGPEDHPNPRMARETSKDMALNAGIMGYLSARDVPTSPFDADAVRGPDPENALGAVMGDQPAEGVGYGGLTISGAGRGGGGGGTGEGLVGLGNLNTIGHGGGGGSGSGYGRGAGGLGDRRSGGPNIRSGAALVKGSLSRELIRRTVHRHINEVQFCYERALSSHPELAGRVLIKFLITQTGAVQKSAVVESTLGDSNVENCIAQAVRRWTFPRPEIGSVIVTYPFQLTTSERNPRPVVRNWATDTSPDPKLDLPPIFNRTVDDALKKELARKSTVMAYEGRLRTVMSLVRGGRIGDALKEARTWRSDARGDLLALIALGEAFEARGNLQAAARAYGSIIDLYPSRADMRRMAGQRLERLEGTASNLIIDTYRNAVAQRPDHPASHRLHAWALLRAERYREALAAMEKGLAQHYPDGRFAGVLTAMKDELGLIARAWLKHDAAAETQIAETLAKFQIRLPDKPSTRFVLHWESDANDVDLHVYDKYGNHASYSATDMPTGGRLAADVTNGYGPEYFTINGEPQAGPYALQAHYYRRGPMGYGMGTLQIITHDGKGNLSFSYRPFIVMADGALVGLGTH